MRTGVFVISPSARFSFSPVLLLSSLWCYSGHIHIGQAIPIHFFNRNMAIWCSDFKYAIFITLHYYSLVLNHSGPNAIKSLAAYSVVWDGEKIFFLVCFSCSQMAFEPFISMGTKNTFIHWLQHKFVCVGVCIDPKRVHRADGKNWERKDTVFFKISLENRYEKKAIRSTI